MNRIQVLFGLFCLLATGASSYAHAEPAEEWSGCYAGIDGGYGSARISGVDILANSAIGSANSTGGAIGGHAGCDQQTGNWVLGAQVSADKTFLSGSHLFINGTGPSNRVTYKVDFLAAVTGRLGYVVQPDMLAYLRAGGSMARTSYTDADPAPLFGIPYTGSVKATRYGWLIGAGLERKIDSNLSAYVEYDYMNFGKKTLTINYSDGLTFSYSFRQELNYFGLGVNYRF